MYREMSAKGKPEEFSCSDRSSWMNLHHGQTDNLDCGIAYMAGGGGVGISCVKKGMFK